MGSELFAVVGLVVGLALFGRPRTLSGHSSPPDSARPRHVRVVIPARNEAASIGNLLADLDAELRALAQQVVAGRRVDQFHIVVVDDGSEDDTAAIARRFESVTVVTAPTRPDGWLGKPWACAVGASHTGAPAAEEFVFLDADVRLAPGALEAIVAERRAAGGVLSVQPFHATGSAVEELSAMFNIVALMGVAAGTQRPTGLFGPVIACTRCDYDAVGGHTAVRSAVIEDVELARAFTATDVPITVRLGGDLVAFRMYPLGMRTLVEGWTKNMALGATTTPVLRSVGVGWWIAALLSASSLAATGWPVERWTGGWTPPVLYLLAALAVRAVLRRVGSFRWWTSAFFPLVTVFFVGVFLRSLWRTYVRRSVTWRGRVIDLRNPAGVSPLAPEADLV